MDDVWLSGEQPRREETWMPSAWTRCFSVIQANTVQLHYSTQIVDVTKVQLLDVVPGRSGKEPIEWLDNKAKEWRDNYAMLPLISQVPTVQCSIRRFPTPYRWLIRSM